MSVFVRLCPSLSAFVCLCPSLSVFVRLCLSLSIFVRFCPSLSVFLFFVRLCPSLSAFVCLCPSLSVFVRLYPSLSVFVRLCLFLSVFVRLCPSLSVFVRLCPSLSVFFVRLCLLLSVFVCLCPSLSVFVCLCIYVFVCLCDWFLCFFSAIFCFYKPRYTKMLGIAPQSRPNHLPGPLRGCLLSLLCASTIHAPYNVNGQIMSNINQTKPAANGKIAKISRNYGCGEVAKSKNKPLVIPSPRNDPEVVGPGAHSKAPLLACCFQRFPGTRLAIARMGKLIYICLYICVCVCNKTETKTDSGWQTQVKILVNFGSSVHTSSHHSVLPNKCCQ